MDALKEVLKARAITQYLSIVERTKPAVRQYHEDVADGIVEEMKDLAPLMIDDIHLYPPSIGCSFYSTRKPVVSRSTMVLASTTFSVTFSSICFSMRRAASRPRSPIFWSMVVSFGAVYWLSAVLS